MCTFDVCKIYILIKANPVYMYFLKKLFNRHFENTYKIIPQNRAEQKNENVGGVKLSKDSGKDCTEDIKHK